MEHASAILADYNLATDPSADLELLNQLAESHHPYVLTAVASHANADLALLERIAAKTEDPAVHVAILSHPAVTAELLASYAGSRLLLDKRFRRKLAADPRTPRAVRRSYIGLWWLSLFSGSHDGDDRQVE